MESSTQPSQARKSTAPDPTDTALAALYARETQYNSVTSGQKMSEPVALLGAPESDAAMYIEPLGAAIYGKQPVNVSASNDASRSSGEPDSTAAVAEPDSRDLTCRCGQPLAAC